jgi:hypothetical protein
MPDPKKIQRPDTPLAATPTPKYDFKEFAEKRAKSDSIAATEKYIKYKPKEGTREAKSEGNRAANQTRTDMGQKDMIVDKSKDKYGQDKYTRRR